MAQRIHTQFVDDVDGSEAAETVTFGLDGSAYEIDLSASNASRLRGALTVYVENGRKVRSNTAKKRTSPSGATNAANRAENKAIRAWAADNGITVPQRGRIPVVVIAQYKAAGGGRD